MNIKWQVLLHKDAEWQKNSLNKKDELLFEQFYRTDTS